MSRCNACGMCKHSFDTIKETHFICNLDLNWIPKTQDTSECKNFEPVASKGEERG